MEPEAYARFGDVLLQNCTERAEVLGIVALGSMAAVTHLPDRWSDHDFFVITTEGAQEAMRQDTTWLPDAASIAMHFRETAHGCKAIYDDGHLIEYAIFGPDELRVARVNDWRVLLDREHVDQRMRELQKATTADISASRPPLQQLLGNFASNLIVASLRARRGERLSARVYLGYAVQHLARVIAQEIESEERSRLDSLDPMRRFELVYPNEASAIIPALMLREEDAALALLDIATQTLPEVITGRVSAAVRAALT